MSNRPDSFMPFYVGDYLRDTLRLTRDQHGGYLLLLMAYWADAEPLPDDDEQLAAIAKATVQEWKKLRAVLAPFFDVKEGRWHHKRVGEELAEATRRYEAKSEAGKRGNAKRWGVATGSQRDSLGDVDATPKSIARRIARGSQPQPHSTTLSPSGSNVVEAQAAARAETAAQPAQGWERDFPRWSKARAELIGPGSWRAYFQNARPNGDETILIVKTGFDKSQIEAQYLEKLSELFGETVTIKVGVVDARETAGAV